MTILALDPGITTGFAIIDHNGVLLRSGNIPCDQIPTAFDNPDEQDLRVVREFVPIPTTGKMNRDLEKVVSFLESRFPNARVVQPGQWKQNRVVVNHPFPSDKFPKASPHQRDAFRLGVYALLFLNEK